ATATDGTRARNRRSAAGEADGPAARAVKCNAVGLPPRHAPPPPEPHPADLGHPDLAPAPVQPPYVQAEGEVGDAESLVHVPLTAARVAVGASVEVSHRLAKVPQRVLLHILRPGCQPCVLRTRLG